MIGQCDQHFVGPWNDYKLPRPRSPFEAARSHVETSAMI